MSKIITAEVINNEAETLREETMKMTDTAKKIRYLHSLGKSVKEIYKLLSEYGVTTKNGGEIRYQHVRNTVMMNLSSK